MINRVCVTFALLCAMLLIPSGGAAAPPDQVLDNQDGLARLRFVHASPNTPNVDVVVDGIPVVTDIAYKDVTLYVSLTAGTYAMQVVETGTAEPVLITTTLTLDANTDYTVAARGIPATIAASVFVDDNSMPPPGQARVRVIHLSPNAPAVDIGIAGQPPMINGLSFPNASSYVLVDAGTYDLEVRLAGTPILVSVTPDVPLAAGAVYTAYAVGLAAGSPPLETVISVDSGLTTLRVVHASPDAPPVDIWVAGIPALVGLNFGDISRYVTLPAGAYPVQAVASGTTGPAVISTTLTLDPLFDYTVAATDLLANITPIVLIDDNTQPATGKARVRFVHLSPDAPPVDVALAGGPVLFSNVAFQQASPYAALDAGVHDLEVRLAGLPIPVFTAEDVPFRAGTVYTVFVMGLATGTPSLQAVLSEDAQYVFWSYWPIFMSQYVTP